MRVQQTSAEPLACFVRRATRCSLKAFTSRLSGRAPARPLSFPTWSATLSGMDASQYQAPNQALQPTRMLVTIRAYARLAPSTRVADL